MHRFFIDPRRWNVEPLTLDEAESHHCADVLRHKPGDRVAVINGAGGEATCTIRSVEKNRVILDVISRASTPPLPARLTLGQAIPKGKTMDFIVQKATELGAHRILPILSERTVVRLDADDAAAKQEKWRQVTIEAAKQCGRTWLPEVAPPASLRETLEQAQEQDLVLLASLQPDSTTFDNALQQFHEVHGRLPADVLILIGPEGDFTPAEMSLARSMGCRPVTLGPIVLRSETAALYALSVLGNKLFAANAT